MPADQNKPSSFKARLKQLKADKGELSRKIGQAKKNGQDASTLIRQMQLLSSQMKALEAELKELSTAETASKPEQPQPPPLPPQFKPVVLPDVTKTSNLVVKQVQGEQWDAYVTNHPHSTIYHTSAIRAVIENSFGHHCHYLAACDESNQIQGILPLVELKSRLFGHFLVSMAFFNYGGVLYSSSNAREALYRAATKLAMQLGVEHIEYRDCFKNPSLPSKSEKVAMLLALPDSKEKLWDEIGTKVRAQVKKGQRNNFDVKQGRLELLDDYYDVFATNMRDLGTPVYSKNFFHNMLTKNESASIILLYHDQKPVSAAFLLGWKNTLEIPWASTIREANALDANMVLYWEVLQFAIQSSYQVFDFGRSSKDANTYRFKKQWGAQPHELYWHYWLPGKQALPQINPNNPKFKLMIAVWQRLPVWLTKIIGPPIVKNLP